MIASREYVKDLISKVFKKPGSLNKVLNKYSTTDEEIVGTWIDGKPIYRKVVKLTSGNTVTKNTVISEGYKTNNNIDTIISISGYAVGSNNRVQVLNTPGISGSLGIMIYFTNVGDISEIHNNTLENSCEITAIFQYTKTTD